MHVQSDEDSGFGPYRTASPNLQNLQKLSATRWNSGLNPPVNADKADHSNHRIVKRWNREAPVALIFLQTLICLDWCMQTTISSKARPWEAFYHYISFKSFIMLINKLIQLITLYYYYWDKPLVCKGRSRKIAALSDKRERLIYKIFLNVWQTFRH